MIFAAILAAYLLGSIPVGLILGKLRGVDLRKIGSGNIGTTNVLRTLGKRDALITLAGDIGKGIGAVLIVQTAGRLFSPVQDPVLGTLFARTSNPDILAGGIAAVAAVTGHIFSVFLKFRGGKGVATGIGAILAYSPHAGLFTITLWLLTAKMTRYSSLSALVSFGALPLSMYLIDPVPEKIALSAVIAVLVFLCHTGNIRRLMNGTESRIGEKAGQKAPGK